jgi:hypothetical protein
VEKMMLHVFRNAGLVHGASFALQGGRSGQAGPRRFAGLVALVALVAAACANTDAAPTHIERFDSAGVRVIVNRGPDHALGWSFERVARFGGQDDGPQSFHGVGAGGVAFDRAGTLYVLDGGNRRVVAFDTDGRHIRTYGRGGSGPGELGQFTSALAVGDDGVVAVFDMQRRGFTRWSAEGDVLESIALPGMLDGRGVLIANGRTYATVTRRDDPASPGVVELLAIGDGDTLRVASVPNPPMKPVQFRNCPVQISGMPAIFAPRFEWAGHDSRIVTNAGPEYELSVLDDGAPVSVVRRDLAPIPATTELAARELDTMRIAFGTGQCAIPPDDVADARGIAPVIPLVRRIAVAPDGAIWIERNIFDARHKTRIDVLDADGGYVGTLPAGAPWPVAFRSPTEFAAIERDDLDLQYIVIYRLQRD